VRRGRDIVDKGLPPVRDLLRLAKLDLRVDAEGETELGDVLNDIAELHADFPAFEHNAENFNKALKAARDLQEILPQLIMQTVDNAEHPPMLIAADGNEDTLRGDYRQRAYQFALLSAALASAFPPDSQPMSVKQWLDDWHLHAHLLFASFNRWTGQHSRTRKGAAVKFISIALKRIGYSGATPAAVEQALRKAPRKWSNLTELILGKPR
jgi:hypothetical protein